MNVVRTVILLLIIIASALSAQTLAVGIGGGISKIQGDNFYTQSFGRSGTYFDRNGTITRVAGLDLGTAPAFSVTVKHRSGILPVDLIAGVRYLPMRGSGTIVMLKYYHVLSPNNVYEQQATSINDIWSYRMGVRGILPMLGLTSFVGAAFTVDRWIDSEFMYEENGATIHEGHYHNGMRYGADVDAGATYRFFDRWEAEASATYSFPNEWGRRDGEVPMNTLAGQLTIYYTIME